ncbi:TlpA disulfide reductase family protein [Mucilaginibacter paludis]|uniref:Alkyl hydroperoxide reductase/ Thiol specific antioxidant/ Mal allergen n=1 Tax=Mucilaginibacter paludis DSM 18603 TaxID=714943 RepID=H1Y9S8_9SPHI|nr:TlpA disulfide reductase family protein [Mucilaginibacter paludis]EHQ31111.1 alkyl hydroperoxide reductase/ Thiol specific antioxidant/ Mal allergen [Mucilaginibacter paludis DSM 18603]
MKLKVVPVILSFCAAALVSCKDKNAFVLNGEITNPKDIKKVYLLQSNGNQLEVVDSAALSDRAQFSFKRPAPTPSLYKLRIGGVLYDLIAQNGDEINFKTNIQDTTNAYEITGSLESDKIKAFNKISNHYSSINDKIIADYNYQTQTLNKPAAPLFAVAMERLRKNQKALSLETVKFMNDNLSSIAAFYASNSLALADNEKELIAYADQIKNQFTDNPLVTDFKKHMAELVPTSVGHKAPDFTILDTDNKPVKLSDYRGKYLMIDFWASWCGPCRQENPNVVRLYNQFKDKGLNILGISLDEKKTDWLKAIADDKLTWRQATEFKNFESPVVRMYHIEAIPSNFMIDPQGNIIAKNITGTELEDFLNKTFSKSQ